MGKGRKWSPEESLHLAESYVDVSEDNGETHVRGTSQDAQVFWSRVYSKFAKRNPGNSPGQYGDRAMSAVSNHWKEKIKLDVRKFNICLRKVYKSKPTGCTDQEKINMAVAIHRGKTDKMQYCHRNYEANDWHFYQCWCALKTHRAFLPPTEEINAEEHGGVQEEEEEEDNGVLAVPEADGEQGQGSANSSITTTTNSTTNSTAAAANSYETPVASRARSRGPGPGVKKSKAKEFDDEYKKKKAKIQEGLLLAQQKRADSFDAYVTNQSRALAFKMAMQAYQMFKNMGDDDEAEKYRDKMEQIMNNNTVADEEGGGMPALTGGNNVGV